MNTHTPIPPEELERRHAFGKRTAVDEFENEADYEARRILVRNEGKRRALQIESPTPKPVLIGAATSAAREPEGRTWLVDRMLQAGRYTLLVAQTGVGKSVMALHLAKSLLTGEPFLGFPVIQDYPRNILYVNADAPSADFDQYVLNIGGIDDRLIVWHADDGEFVIQVDDHIELLADLCLANNIGYVIIDAWGSVFKGSDWGPESRGPADRVRRLVDKLGLDGILMIDHANKDKENKGQAAGSYGKEAAASIIWRYWAEGYDNRGKPRTWFTALKRIRTVPKFEVIFDDGTWDIQRGGVGVTGSKADDDAKRKQQATRGFDLIVARVISATPGITTNTLREAVGADRQKLKDSVEMRLVPSGYVRLEDGPRGSKLHYLTVEGQAWVDSCTSDRV